MTVVTDQTTGHVLYVADNGTKESLEGFFETLEPADLLRIEAVSMDMWPPYISVVENILHKAEEKICFDKFHVAKHLAARGERPTAGSTPRIRPELRCIASETCRFPSLMRLVRTHSGRTAGAGPSTTGC